MRVPVLADTSAPTMPGSQGTLFDSEPSGGDPAPSPAAPAATAKAGQSFIESRPGHLENLVMTLLQKRQTERGVKSQSFFQATLAA